MTIEGKWVLLDTMLGTKPTVGRGYRGHRRHEKARMKRKGAWVVLYPGRPEVGEKIWVRKATGQRVQRYVVMVINWCRSDGQVVVSVSKTPVPRPPAPTIEAWRPAPATPVRKNLRECPECGGRCSVGAKACEECKAEARTVPAEDFEALRADDVRSAARVERAREIEAELAKDLE